MQQPTIAVDFDDVLMGFNQGFVYFHNRKYGTRFRYEDIISYDMEQMYGCAPEVMLERVLAFYASEDHAEAEPIRGAVRAIKRLRRSCTLDIVTSRPETVLQQTHSWVERFLPDTFRTLHFTNGFAGPHGARRRLKSEVCEEIGAKILIEDALHHAEEVANKGISVLLPDRPWNRNCTPKGVVRVHSWDEVVTWIEEGIQK